MNARGRRARVRKVMDAAIEYNNVGVALLRAMRLDEALDAFKGAARMMYPVSVLSKRDCGQDFGRGFAATLHSLLCRGPRACHSRRHRHEDGNYNAEGESRAPACRSTGPQSTSTFDREQFHHGRTFHDRPGPRGVRFLYDGICDHYLQHGTGIQAERLQYLSPAKGLVALRHSIQCGVLRFRRQPLPEDFFGLSEQRGGDPARSGELPARSTVPRYHVHPDPFVTARIGRCHPERETPAPP